MKIQSAYTKFTGNDGLPVQGYLFIGIEYFNPEVSPKTVYYNPDLTLPIAQPVPILNGYATRLGTPINLYTDSAYSLLLKDSAGRVVFSEPSVTQDSLPSSSVFDYLNQVQIAAVQAGSTSEDLTASIQAAINASCHLYFPSGLYNVTTLVFNKPIHLEGAGYQCTTIRQSTILSGYDSTLCVKSDTTSSQVNDVSITNLTVLGPDSSPTFSEHQHLVSANGVNNFKMSECCIKGFKGDGIYFGSDTGRANTNIVVTNCIFDGINKQNRNAISVIYGSNVSITNNKFFNTTSATMPGAVDFEPNNEIDVINNISVTDNYFENIGGNVGVISAPIGQLNAQPINFNFSRNVFTNIPSLFITIIFPDWKYGSTEIPNYNIQINENQGTCGQFFEFHGLVGGVSIANNTVKQYGTSLFGFTTRTSGYGRYVDTIRDCVVTGNIFESLNSTHPLFASCNTDGLTFTGNSLSGTSEGIRLGKMVTEANVTYYVKNVSITGNRFSGPTGACFITSKNTTHHVDGLKSIVDGATCRYSSNEALNHRFPAWLTDFCGEVLVTGDDSSVVNRVPTFSGLTLPDSFPVGISRTFTNSGCELHTSLPCVSQAQGVLTTYHETRDDYKKWIYQTYHPVANAVALKQYDGLFFIRHRVFTSNTWGSWYRMTGTLITNNADALPSL